MGKRRMTVLAVVTSFVLLAALLASIYSVWWGDGPAPIILPEEPATFAPIEDGPSTAPSASDDAFVRVEITPENVQSVIETLSRPDAYSADLRLTRRYYDTSTTTLRKIHRRDALLACSFYSASGTLEKSLVTDGDRCYTWLTENGAVSENALGNASYDSLQNTPTYEDLLALEPSQIHSASYSVVAGEDCITVMTVDPESGYEDTYHIAISSGLLLQFSREKDGQQRLFLEMTGFDLARPEDSAFFLPDGTMPQ